MKLEFNVVRMDNEDVITTSGQSPVCALHPDANHMYITSGAYDGGYGATIVDGDLYSAGEVISSHSGGVDIDRIVGNPETGEWYYLDPSVGTIGQYRKCNGDHSGYTLVVH